jgi:uncharacterized membrane protein YdbT with pleckstrin-like domain
VPHSAHAHHDAHAKGHAPARKTDRATAAGYPPDSGPEEEVLVVRRAMFRARPFTAMGLTLVLVGGVVGGFALGMVTPMAIACWAAAAAALVVLAVWKIRTFDSALVITNKRTTEREGLLSKNISEVLHDNIRNVQVRQTFIQRVWGVGEILISSAGQDDFEIKAKDIPRPDRVREVIDLYRPL